MAASINVLKGYRLHNILVTYTNKVFRSLHASQRCNSSDSSSGNLSQLNHASGNDKSHPETTTKNHTSELVKGKIAQKQPINISLEAGKTYFFCTCGYSKKQPFCDSSHKAPNFAASRPHHIRYQPLRFTVDEPKEYWLCLCKQSNNRPFCDGTHKRSDIQNAALS